MTSLKRHTVCCAYSAIKSGLSPDKAWSIRNTSVLISHSSRLLVQDFTSVLTVWSKVELLSSLWESTSLFSFQAPTSPFRSSWNSCLSNPISSLVLPLRPRLASLDSVPPGPFSLVPVSFGFPQISLPFHKLCPFFERVSKKEQRVWKDICVSPLHRIDT